MDLGLRVPLHTRSMLLLQDPNSLAGQLAGTVSRAAKKASGREKNKAIRSVVQGLRIMQYLLVLDIEADV